MSKFITTSRSNDCPVCGDTSGKCRTQSDSPIVLCMNTTDQYGAPSGWKFLGLAKNPIWGMLAPIDNDNDGLTELERRVQRDRLKTDRDAKRAIEDEKRVGQLPTLAARHKLLSSKPHTLTPSQNADLIRRGLNQTEIDQCLSRGYLWQEWQGYGIAAIDPVTGLITGGQKSNDRRGQTVIGKDGDEYQIPKYSWLLKGQTNLQETGQNPLAFWKHAQFDPTKPADVRLCEGFLKSLISAIKAWRSDCQVIYIGAAGTNFPDGSLSRVLSTLPEHKETMYSLCPDAGAVVNSSVMSGYKTLIALIPSLKVIWWNQWHKKTSLDIDELPQGQKTVILPWKEFYSLSMGTDRSGANQWIRNRKFTPDHTIDSQYFAFRCVSTGEILAIRSGLGTGKTEFMIREILLGRAIESATLNFDGAIVIAPTINLCANLNERIEQAQITVGCIGDLTVLNDKAATQSLRSATAVQTLCPDSILSIAVDDIEGKVLILDEAGECAKVFWYRKTHIAKIRKAAIDRLSQLMEAAAAVVLLDGNLSDSVVSWYSALCPSKIITKVLNTRAKTMEIRIHVGDGESHSGDFAANIGVSGERFILATDTKSDALAHTNYALTADTCKTGKLDESDSLVESWEQLAMRSGKAFIESEQPDSMAYSPVAQSGWDLSGVDGYFPEFYGLYKGVSRVDEICQSIARYRDFSVVRDLWIASRGLEAYWSIDSGNTSNAAITESLYKFAANLPGYLGADRDDLKEATALLLESLTADPTSIAMTQEIAASNFERRHLRGCLIHALLESGHSVECVTAQEAFLELKKEVGKCKRSTKLALAAAIIEARVIEDGKAASVIERARLVKPGELAALSRFKLESRLPGIAKSEAWNSEDINDKGESLASDFVHRLPKLALRAERFWSLVDPRVAVMKGQKQWQKFLDDGWIDISALKIEYVSTRKIREILGDFLPDLFTFFVNTPDGETHTEQGIEADKKNPALLYKIEIPKLVRKLTSGKGGLESLKGRSHFRYLKAILSPYGLDLTEDAMGNIAIELPCLDSESELGQVYAAVDLRLSKRLEDEPHEWEAPAAQEPTVQATAVDLSGEWFDFIQSVRMQGRTAVEIQSLKAEMNYVPDEVWGAVMA